MAHRPESARFEAPFKHALETYEKKTGVSLTQHPLAIKLQNCDSVEAITGILHNQVRAFGNLQGSDKIMKSIETTVSIISKLSSATSLVDAFGVVRSTGAGGMSRFFDLFLQLTQPTKAIQACIAILLDVRAILWFIRR